MAITATGIGSGIDISNIVKVLVESEQTPKQALLDNLKTDVDAKLSAFGALKSALSNFQNVIESLKDGTGLNNKKVTVSHPELLEAEISDHEITTVGSSTLRIEQLASVHKIMTNAVPNGTNLEGNLYINATWRHPSSNETISISATDTLEDIAAKVNNHSNNDFLTARVTNNTSNNEKYIVFTGKESGWASDIFIDSTSINGSSIDAYFSQANVVNKQIALHARAFPDGIATVHRSTSNRWSEIFPGLALTALKADNVTDIDISVEKDTDAIKQNMVNFVDAYNALVSLMDDFSAYNADSEEAGILLGDSTLRSLSRQVRNIVSDTVSVDGNNVTLYDLGFSIDKNGTMSLDNSKLDVAINDIDLEDFFNQASTGVANKFDSLIDNYVSAAGEINSRVNIFEDKKGRIEQQEEDLNVRMEAYKARLLTQYNLMDSIVSMLNQQSDSLSQRLTSLSR